MRPLLLVFLLGCSGAQATVDDVNKASDTVREKLSHCRTVARRTYYDGKGLDAALTDYEACKKAEGVQ
jgi:hypothetical protein